ncbi:hypothetical protein KBZ08_14130 [Cyanobium sp. Candia 9D4]|uniref:hypothetical protein n=1 Tax=Cyanobium sp. Candia 9D4 TaxID=2823707 RepID=UPI0020CC8A09|nr:hypothetical protein [Cyanobium sp. Candia 9D4]MCP9935048.1 hypothetical protein [Cyanobium sp. Candia 9D4]
MTGYCKVRLRCARSGNATADISIQLLMDTTNTLQEIESRVTARVFGAIHNPEEGPEVRRVLAELLDVLD